jgi:hypothetical protein
LRKWMKIKNNFKWKRCYGLLHNVSIIDGRIPFCGEPNSVGISTYLLVGQHVYTPLNLVQFKILYGLYVVKLEYISY